MPTHKNKPRLTLALYHRGAHSLPPTPSFHYALLLKPKHAHKNSTILDATNFFHQDPLTHEILNPNQQWWFRVRHNVDPLSDHRFLCGLIMGKLPGDVSLERLESMVRGLPLPRVGMKETENCMTWVRDAVELLMREGILGDFEWEEVRAQAVDLGREVLEGSKKGELEGLCRWREYYPKKA